MNSPLCRAGLHAECPSTGFYPSGVLSDGTLEPLYRKCNCACHATPVSGVRQIRQKRGGRRA